MNPRVTVVVPTYRRPGLLRHTLRSVVDQTFLDYEVLVCDDGGDDETRAVVESFCDERLRYHRNETNLGQALNVLTGFREAKGEFISLLHDDDLLDPTGLELLVAGLEAHPDAAFAFGDHWIMDGAGRRLEERTALTTEKYGRAHLAQGFHRPCRRIALVDLSVHFGLGTTYRKELLDLDDYPPEVGDYCDRWLGYLACRDGWGAYYVPDRTSSYRQHGNQVSSARGLAHAKAGLFCHERFVTDPRLSDQWPALQVMKRLHELNLAIEMLRVGRRDEARDYLSRGWRSRPFYAAVGFALSLLPERASQAIIRAARK